MTSTEVLKIKKKMKELKQVELRKYRKLKSKEIENVNKEGENQRRSFYDNVSDTTLTHLYPYNYLHKFTYLSRELTSSFRQLLDSYSLDLLRYLSLFIALYITVPLVHKLVQYL